MGHRLPNHDGACRNLHGHRYVAEVTVEGHVLERMHNPQEGMLLDFVRLKRALRAEVLKLDHRFLLYDGDELCGTMRDLPGVVTVPFVPTAENIASALWKACAASLHETDPSVKVMRVRVQETEDSWAEAGIEAYE